ncbi:MAG: hypothetical protein U0Q18_19320 [Bryobacteraceae bacterium]
MIRSTGRTYFHFLKASRATAQPWQRRASVFFCVAGVVLFGTGNLAAHDPHDPMVTVAVSPNYAQDRTVLAASDALSLKTGLYAILKSTDGGVTWSPIPGLPNNSKVWSIVFSPAYSQDQTIYLAGTGGIARSTDQGVTWTSLGSQPVQRLVLSPNFALDNTIFIITPRKTISKSADRGQSWTSVPVPSALASGLNAIAISPNYTLDKMLLLGTTSDGIFKSVDDGTTWTSVTSGIIVPAINQLLFSPAFGTDGTVFAATSGSGVLLSTNAGDSWGSASAGITDLGVTSIAAQAAPSALPTVWVTTASGQVFSSATMGASWSLAAGVPRVLSPRTCVHFQAIAAAASGSGTVLYLAAYEGLWTSSDGASSWQYMDLLPTRLVRYIHLSPTYAEDKTVFASTYGGGNLWSTTGGSSWTIRNTGMRAPYTDASGISPNFGADGIAFSSDDLGLQRISGHASSWDLMIGTGSPAYPRALAVSPGFSQDATIFIGLSGGTSTGCSPAADSAIATPTGLFGSTDGGSTWFPTSLSGVTSIFSISISPLFNSDRLVLAASPNNGLYQSSDGGVSWAPVASLTSVKISIVKFSPAFAADRTIFAADNAGGVYKSSDAGLTWTTLPRTGSLRVLALEPSPNYASDQILFAGTLQKGLVKFTDGGNTMVPIGSFPDVLVTAVAVSPNFASDHTLFAAGYHGIFKSRNGGSTWTNTAAPARIEESQSSAGSLEQPPLIVFQGNWKNISPSTRASSNAFMQTSASQASATLTFTGSGVGWLTQTGPFQGTASITVDGVPDSNVNLFSAIDRYQQQIWNRQGLACAKHTVTITAQSGQVSVDAFNVRIDGCPLP